MAKAAKKETAQDSSQTEFDKLAAVLDAHKVRGADDHFQAELNKTLKAWARQYRKEMKGAPNLKEQINFIVEYVGYMALDGKIEETLTRISEFLDMQTPDSEDERMKISFTGGYPDDIFVYVDILQDVDLVDIHSMLNFYLMNVTLPGKNKWTKKAAADFFKGVENDFYFDFGRDEIMLCDYYADAGRCCLTVMVQEACEDDEE
ncbi:MAG: hypothetical protein HZA15_08105 [Nitrospirae bacterium]|nr:hypothetical protein [Nitrospirota bacterium]